MAIYGPYREGKSWRIRWTTSDGRKRTKRHATKASAEKHISALRKSGGDADGDVVAARSAIVALDLNLNEIFDQADWLKIISGLAKAVAEGSDPTALKRARVVAQLAATARPYLDLREQERRIAELEARQKQIMELAQRRRGRSKQRGEARQAGEAS